uniref:TIP_N domain-containing protein n=1 Tax=Ascaris lumbricoides TaxID=6252 RepID=A0A0M3HM15_ASCLU
MYSMKSRYRIGISFSQLEGINKLEQSIWGDREESEDEEDLRAGFGSSSSRKRSKNYSAPVAFVSGGVKHGNRIEGEVSSTSFRFFL